MLSLLQEESEKELMTTDSIERNGTDEDLSLKCNLVQNSCSDSTDNIVDDMLSAKDPTLVFHEKPSLGSSSARSAAPSSSDELSHNMMVTNGVQDIPELRRENDRDVAHEGEGGSNLDESNLFSFGPGIQKAGSQKVKFSSTFFSLYLILILRAGEFLFCPPLHLFGHFSCIYHRLVMFQIDMLIHWSYH